MSPYNVNGSNAARKRESPCRCCYLNLTRRPCCHVMGCRQLPALGAYVRSPCDEEMPSKAHFLSGGGGGGGGGILKSSLFVEFVVCFCRDFVPGVDVWGESRDRPL